MKTHKIKSHFQTTSAIPRRKINTCYLALAATLTTGLVAQSQTPAASLSDAQAMVLLQSLAKGQGTSTEALSAAQLQLLSNYLQHQGQALPSAAGTDLAAAGMRRPQSPAAAATLTPVVTSAAPAVVSGKKPGTIRIGVVEPKIQMGQGNSGVSAAEPLRALTLRYLSGPAFQVIPIAAMLPTQIDAEIKEKECDYVLYSSISQKMTSSGFGMLQKAMPLASMIPMVGMAGGIAGLAMSGVAGAAMSGASGLSGSVKAKSEVTYEYKLMSPGNSTPVLANSVKAKAKRDGEDIITPLIEQAAGAILTQVSKK